MLQNAFLNFFFLQKKWRKFASGSWIPPAAHHWEQYSRNHLNVSKDWKRNANLTVFDIYRDKGSNMYQQFLYFHTPKLIENVF